MIKMTTINSSKINESNTKWIQKQIFWQDLKTKNKQNWSFIDTFNGSLKWNANYLTNSLFSSMKTGEDKKKNKLEKVGKNFTGNWISKTSTI